MMFLRNATYDSCEIIKDSDGPISIFKNVKICNNPDVDSKTVLRGTYIPISCTPHYFHFLKECYGFYLYFKQKYQPNAKYLDVKNIYFYPEYQKMNLVCDYCYQTINDGVTVENFFTSNFEIEKLVILFDSQKLVIGNDYVQPDYSYTPGINNVLRNTMLKDVELQKAEKKIYLSRKIVSQYLPNYPVKEGHTALDKWKKEQLRLRYVEPEIEQKIEDYYGNKGYEIVQLSGMELLEQVTLFQRTKEVAGLLGTAFYNGIFANENTAFTALRINPDYFYNFEMDIKTVLPNAAFHYENRKEIFEFLKIKDMIKS